MIGGTTYAEARVVAMLNQDSTAAINPGIPSAGIRFLLGGTCVHNSSSFLEMIRTAANNFPASISDAPVTESVSGAAPALNLNLGGVSVSLGGPSGTGVYRTSGEGVGVQADGIRDGMRNLMGKVKQGVDRIGIS
jgi:hypothetical protein